MLLCVLRINFTLTPIISDPNYFNLIDLSVEMAVSDPNYYGGNWLMGINYWH